MADLVITENYSPTGSDITATTADDLFVILVRAAGITVDLSGLTADEYIQVRGPRNTILVKKGDNQTQYAKYYPVGAGMLDLGLNYKDAGVWKAFTPPVS